MSAIILQFPTMGRFGNRIKEYRQMRDLTQQELADLAGCSKMHISGLERGVRRLDLHWMQVIAAVLGIEPGDLLLPGDNSNAAQTDAERRMLALYRMADPQMQEQVLRVTEAVTGFQAHPLAERDAA